MKRERYDYINAMAEAFDDLPDGAFLGMMEECGIDIDELAESAKIDAAKEVPPKQRKKNRRRR